VIDSRSKGAKAELDVCRTFGDWWGQVEPGCIFVRSPGSGGWGNAKSRGEFEASGDIMTSAKHFPFCVEVKHREGWAESTFRSGRPSPVWGWWRQCQRAADEMGRVPMLWFRRNREAWRVMVPSDYAGGGFVTIGGGGLEPSRWNPRLLRRRGVDYGKRVPVWFGAIQLLTCPPARFAR
jgi:hypothetical protein